MTIGDEYRKPEHRIAGYALLDLVPTVIAAAGIAYYVDKRNNRSLQVQTLVITFMLLILLAIGLHRITNTPTMLNYQLGLSKCPELSGRCDKK